MFDNNSVIITGMGMVSALGSSVEESIESLRNGNIYIGQVDLPGATIQKPVFKARLSVNPECRTMSLAKYAFNEALKQAGLKFNSAVKTGICIGTTVASQLNDITFYSQYREKRLTSYNAVHKYLAGNLAEAFQKEYGTTGPAITIVNACSSGTDAIGIGLDWLRTGECDQVIVGGADELSIITIAGFNALGILSSVSCKPFDLERDGLNLGEGAGFLVLETAYSAKRRNADVIARCCSYSTASDAYHPTSPRSDGLGLELAVIKAMAEAEIAPEQISFINAHGTGTKNNDKTEGNLFKKLFGGLVDVYSTKGYTGHTLGAAGAIEAIMTISALKEQWLPKTAGFETFDAQVGIVPVKNKKEISAKYAMSTSLAFGGINSAIIFGKLE